MQSVQVYICRSTVVVSLGWLCTVTFAAEIDVPAGQVLKHSFTAQGVQIYQCIPSTDGKFAWVFKAPEARLFGSDGSVVAIHYAGPTWESVSDGGKITGQRVASSPSEGKDSIPQLLLSAKVISNGELFEDISFIQRVNTRGGTAPEAGCDATATFKQVSVPYTARYEFYRRR